MLLLAVFALLLAPIGATDVQETDCPVGDLGCNWKKYFTRAHTANLVKLKCDMLLYRSFVKDNQCFFAINKPMNYSAGASECETALSGAKLHTIDSQSAEITLESVIRAMHLDGGDYHIDSTAPYSRKGIICKYSPIRCPVGERSDMPGRCMQIFNEKRDFESAFSFCTERGSDLPRILNNDDNRAVAKLVGSSPEPAWVDYTGSNQGWGPHSIELIRKFFAKNSNWFSGTSAQQYRNIDSCRYGLFVDGPVRVSPGAHSAASTPSTPDPTPVVPPRVNHVSTTRG
ncbi:hypothetical protein PMAYCL1PPCAC_26252 [Pristionchus mayeri]|uniref:C-type lectin n=1 Tax=Pristionchus mayeri TaxID=1317129 RepID=A0AAN5D4R3_9BILA|nr:hypothetical protein PMAYCL1PPCAC_26252 [Pristionchus mayeri]